MRIGDGVVTRLFVSGTFSVGELVEPAADDQRKLRVVLRAVDGDAVEIADSSGRRFDGRVVLDEKTVRVRLARERAAPVGPRVAITLAQGLPKGQKMEYVVEKATELGVARIVPFASARSAGDTARSGKVERWRRIAKTAAEQCGRRDVPDVDEPIDFAGLVERMRAAELALFPYELAGAKPLRETLPDLLGARARVLVAIGPEGGFSSAEARAAEAAGAHTISLGTRILRTETAGLVACAAILYASGDI